jgi:hypothetical protein
MRSDRLVVIVGAILFLLAVFWILNGVIAPHAGV